MGMKKICVFLFNGFSDWEISYLTPEINKSEQFDLIYFSVNGDIVTSMGGLRIKTTTSLADLKIEEIELLILPGGSAWETEKNTEINGLVRSVSNNKKPIAAICGATVYLGKLNMLNNLKHTSNDLNYLKNLAPNYSGERYYQNSLAETDENIITAKGIAPIEFAREIFRETGLKSEVETEKWYQLFKNGIWSE